MSRKRGGDGRGGAGEVSYLEVLIICNLAEHGKELPFFFFFSA